MSIVLLLTLALVVLVLVALVGVVRAVRRDGYGQRTPPPSHRHWDERPSAPW